jgi:7,8-dihydropterin-6-yl-methyl-4-(beta-D-ribofuranosyl)aminobenzene 5'-phosphate synthase
MDERSVLSRRDMLRLGAMAGGVLLAGSLGGCDSGTTGGDQEAETGSSSSAPDRRPTGEAATSRALAGAPPVVDRLAVWVLVDNAYDIFLKSGLAGDGPFKCEVQRAALGTGPRLSAAQLHSEFGLGFHLESTRGNEARRYLLDFGLSKTAGAANIEFLNIDLRAVNGLILSHGHFDHFGGLLPLLTANQERLPAGLPLFVGGEDAFCYRWMVPPQGERQSFGVLDRDEIDQAGVRTVMVEQPAVIGDHAFTTGSIARTTFEKVQPAPQVELGVRDGAGCDPSHFTAAEQVGQLVPDQFWSEHATCFHVKDRGLVVMSSCGHAGIINTVKAAQAASGVERIHAVLGGFHLASAPEPYVAQTVDALRKMNPDFVAPMHCSGRTFTRLAEAAMPGKVIPPSTGTRLIFGA